MQTGLTQEAVCELLVNHKNHETWWLSDVEKDKTKPSIQELYGLFGILEFNLEERGLALLLSGYPPETEDEGKIGAAKGFVDGWRWPAYLIDFTWRLYHANRAALECFGLDDDDAVLDRRENMLGLVLNKDGKAYKQLSSGPHWADFLTGQVAHFKQEHLHRRNEKWFRQSLASLMNHEEFARRWNVLEHASLLRLQRVMMLSGFDQLELQWSEVKKAFDANARIRTFTIFSCPLWEDQRFRVRFLVPAAFKITDLHEEAEMALSASR